MRHLIGVDGGATKSSALLADFNGKIIAERKGRALNYHAVGQKQAEENLRKLLSPFFKKYKGIKTAVIGFAGLDTAYDLRIYKKIVKRVFPAKINFFLFNDARIALEAVSADRNLPRVLIISGTGSSVYGEFKNKQAKAIGWDFLAGDEGSAYWMGMEAIKRTVQFWDGRGKKTILGEMVLRKTRSQNMSQFLSKLYRDWHEKHRDFKKQIASFALEVKKAFSKGDPVAKEIVREGALQLALGVEAVVKRLKVERETVCVGFVGSNFKISGLLTSLCLKIKKKHSRVNFVYKVDPVRGAINLALKIR